jgi:hypothetical protein
MLHLLPYTSQDDARFRAKHSAIKADRFFQSLFIFVSSRCLGLQAVADCNHHVSQSPTKKSRVVRSGDRGGQQVDPLGRSSAQPTDCSRLSSPHCVCTAALRHVENNVLM